MPPLILFHARQGITSSGGVLRGMLGYVRENRPWNIVRTGHELARKELTVLIRRIRPAGLVLAHPLPDFDFRSLPVVHTLMSGAEPRHHVLCISDDLAVGEIGARHLLETQPAALGFAGYDRALFARQREEGFRRCLERTGRNCAVFHFPSGRPRPAGYLPEMIRSPLAAWLRQLAKPAAVLAANDGIGHDIAHLCRQLRIRIPEDLALLGVDDNFAQCQTVVPHLSSILPPFAEIGWQAAQLLDRWMQGRRPDPGVRSFPPAEVSVRASSRIQRVEDPLVRTALDFIRDAVSRPFHVRDLLRHSGVSARTLELRFLRALGRTPLMEIRRQRVQRAKDLLGATDDSITAVARRSGFRTLLRLSVVFRELTGFSPSEYRSHRRGSRPPA